MGRSRQLPGQSSTLRTNGREIFPKGESRLWPSRESATKLTNGNKYTRASRVVQVRGGKLGLSSNEPPHLFDPKCDPVTEPDLPKLGEHQGEISQGISPFCVGVRISALLRSLVPRPLLSQEKLVVSSKIGGVILMFKIQVGGVILNEGGPQTSFSGSLKSDLCFLGRSLGVVSEESAFGHFQTCHHTGVRYGSILASPIQSICRSRA